MTTHAMPGGGCAARNATARACLYGATVAFTMACSAFSVASSRSCPPCSTPQPWVGQVARTTSPQSHKDTEAARGARVLEQRMRRRESSLDACRGCMAAAHEDFQNTLARAGIGS